MYVCIKVGNQLVRNAIFVSALHNPDKAGEKRETEHHAGTVQSQATTLADYAADTHSN
jgi:hypothetical protein